MISLKGCPKCRGDVYYQTDMYGAFWRCLQCGRYHDLTLEETQKQLQGASKVIPQTTANVGANP